MKQSNVSNRLVASPCCKPEMSLDEVLAAYRAVGFSKFEVFTSWTQSAFDIDQDPSIYLAKGRQYGLEFSSLHLPAINDDLDTSLARAIKAAHFAQAIGAGVVLFKASTRANYIRAAKPFLDATEHLTITPVLQNHAGSSITSLGDFRDVINGIDDPRMKTLFEVGQFHTAGVLWPDGYELLGDTIALVHIKDQIAAQSVPFGTGEIDLPSLFAHMRSVGYDGNYVVEMEVADHENTLRYLADACDYIAAHCMED